MERKTKPKGQWKAKQSRKGQRKGKTKPKGQWKGKTKWKVQRNAKQS
jgi:hypothetical protein